MNMKSEQTKKTETTAEFIIKPDPGHGVIGSEVMKYIKKLAPHWNEVLEIYTLGTAQTGVFDMKTKRHFSKEEANKTIIDNLSTCGDKTIDVLAMHHYSSCLVGEIHGFSYDYEDPHGEGPDCMTCREISRALPLVSGYMPFLFQLEDLVKHIHAMHPDIWHVRVEGN